MEEEIDLWSYFEAILKKWLWVLGVGILAGILAFITLSFIPSQYESTALVAIIQSDDVIQFDPRFRETAENQPLNAFPELATSDEILSLILSNVNIPENIVDIQQLNAKLSVSQGADRSLLLLTATDKNPRIAAHLANSWASEFVLWANEIYSDQDVESVVFFEDQLAISQNNLAALEETLNIYQGINPSETISNTLNIYSNTQRAYLQEKQDLVTLRQDAEALRMQILAISNQNNYSLSEITALTLQLRFFHAEKVSSILLTIDSTSDLDQLSPANQIAFLDALIEVIELRSTQLFEELEEFAPQIQQLQQQFQEANTEHVRLLRNIQVAEETYLALATKVEEKRITINDTTQRIRLVSKGAVPNNAVSPRKLLVISLAIFLGLSGSVFILLLKTWWNSNFHDQTG